MNRFFYSVSLFFLSPLVVLYLAFRAFKSPDYRGRWSERFGLAVVNPSDLLIHTVSMGETLAAVPLIRLIRQSHPELQITVTTTTPTGSAEVIKAFGNEIKAGRMQHCYLPFDIAWCVKRFLRQLSPQWCIIMETELWPNLLHFAKKRGVKLMLANARLSAKSAAKYQKQMKLTSPMMASLDCVAVQTAIEGERFVTLGVDCQKVIVCGSVKFDLTIASERLAAANHLRAKWGREQSPIWVAGSVHPGEFEHMLRAHKALLESWPDALLILVPRHPEQFEAAANQVLQHGLQLTRRSQGVDVTAKTQVLLGDTMGELLTLYGIGDQAFVGGTLVENGGHNPLEPAAMGLSVIMGPHRWNFAEIASLLEEAGALTPLASASDLVTVLTQQFEDGAALTLAQNAGMAVVETNRGALKRQFSLVEKLLE